MEIIAKQQQKTIMIHLPWFERGHTQISQLPMDSHGFLMVFPMVSHDFPGDSMEPWQPRLLRRFAASPRHPVLR